MFWHLKSFDELSTLELYKIIQLRVEVFVVEQNCPYSELDSKDFTQNVLHLFAKEGDEISCYLRILPPGCSYPEMPSIGRVVTHPQQRGTGIGHQLIKRANQTLDELWPDLSCHISAQSHLQDFYIQHDYISVGEGYLEDDIPHIGMQRASIKSRLNQ